MISQLVRTVSIRRRHVIYVIAVTNCITHVILCSHEVCPVTHGIMKLFKGLYLNFLLYDLKTCNGVVTRYPSLKRSEDCFSVSAVLRSCGLTSSAGQSFVRYWSNISEGFACSTLVAILCKPRKNWMSHGRCYLAVYCVSASRIQGGTSFLCSEYGVFLHFPARLLALSPQLSNRKSTELASELLGSNWNRRMNEIRDGIQLRFRQW